MSMRGAVRGGVRVVNVSHKRNAHAEVVLEDPLSHNCRYAVVVMHACEFVNELHALEFID